MVLLSQAWWNDPGWLIGILIGILAIVIAIVIYFKQRARKQITYLVLSEMPSRLLCNEVLLTHASPTPPCFSSVEQETRSSVMNYMACSGRFMPEGALRRRNVPCSCRRKVSVTAM
jgi:hypothetical protein